MRIDIKRDLGARRVLVHRQGSLGDTIVALPSFRVIRRAFPNAEIRLLTNIPRNAVAAPAMDLLQPPGLASSAIEYPSKTREPLAVLALLRRVRAWKPDVAVYLVEARAPWQHRRDEALMRLCGVRRRVGYDPSGYLSVSQKLPDGLYESESARLLRAVAPLGQLDLDDPVTWDLGLTRTESDKATVVMSSVLSAACPHPIIAFSIGTKNQPNDYEDRNWRAVLAGLSRYYPSGALVAVGAPSERSRCDTLLAGWAGRTLNTCGDLNVRESAAVLARSHLFLGHDSGPMHLAAAAGTPCVAVFSSRNPPGVWYPHGAPSRILRTATSCSPCGLYHCMTEGKRCILSIPPATVIDACRELLAYAATSETGARRVSNLCRTGG